jgi:hypothetical protein
VVPRAGLDAMVRRKILSLYRDSNPIIPPAAQLYTTELSRLLSDIRVSTIKGVDTALFHSFRSNIIPLYKKIKLNFCKIPQI